MLVIISYIVLIKKYKINKKIKTKNLFFELIWTLLNKYNGKKINNNLIESEKIKLSIFDSKNIIHIIKKEKEKNKKYF